MGVGACDAVRVAPASVEAASGWGQPRTISLRRVPAQTTASDASAAAECGIGIRFMVRFCLVEKEEEGGVRRWRDWREEDRAIT